jgi:hypothetical protein
LRPCGEDATVETGEGAEKEGLGVCGVSNRRAAALVTATKRGDWAVEDPEVRREAWYARWFGVWNVVLGDGGADMVGEEVSIIDV